MANYRAILVAMKQLLLRRSRCVQQGFDKHAVCELIDFSHMCCVPLHVLQGYGGGLLMRKAALCVQGCKQDQQGRASGGHLAGRWQGIYQLRWLVLAIVVGFWVVMMIWFGSYRRATLDCECALWGSLLARHYWSRQHMPSAGSVVLGAKNHGI